MLKMNLLLICVTFLPIVWTNPQNPTSDLDDFEFDGVSNSDFSETFTKSDGIDRADVNWGDTTDENENDNERNAFDVNQQRIRNSLVRAIKDKTYTKNFAQILPIMRTLTKQQRLVLASLISAQTSARSSGNVMNLAQVSFIFLKDKISNSNVIRRFMTVFSLKTVKFRIASKQYVKGCFI